MRVNLPPPLMWDETRTVWDAKALLLLEALQIYEDSLCSGCGQSGFHAADVANTREFTTDTYVCLGCEVRERFHENAGESKPPMGQKLFVRNLMGSAEPE